MNASRIGNFTSSSIHNLIKSDRSGKGFGAPALTYIKQKNYERMLGRSLTTDMNARPVSWGNCLEPIAFAKLPFDYELTSKDTITHPDYPFWKGSPDGTSTLAVFDIKCPWTLNSFCELVASYYTDYAGSHADHIKDVAPEYYWQLVSNAILTGKDWAELIVYVPYKADLNEIKLIALDDNDFTWINYADDRDLPYLIEGGYYQDLNVIAFHVPESDKSLLTERVEMAGKLLIEPKTIRE